MGEWVNLNAVSKGSFNFEIEHARVEDIDRINSVLSELVAQGKKNKEPLFEAITEIICREGRTYVYFKEMIEPELVESKHKGHFIACNLYPSSNYTDEIKPSSINDP